MEDVYIYNQEKYDGEEIKKGILDSKVLNVISPKDKILIKPNWVQESRDSNSDWSYVITHPVIITSVIELVSDIIAYQGEIVLADAPMTGSSFEKILEHMPVSLWRKICEEKGVAFSIIDFRDEEWEMAENGIILNRKKLVGDPKGKVLTNLKDNNSEFFNKPKTNQLLYGADYDVKETNLAHNGSDNFYSVSKTAICADVFINIPKLKTHRKAGITCCLKNLIGINTNKNLLPHHTIGTPKDGGDQFESSSSSTSIESGLTMVAKNIVVKFKFLSPLLVPLKKIAVLIWGDNKKKPRSGGWYGNDTLWRTILDLNKVLFYGNEDGLLREDNANSKKKYIGIVDGILAGQGNGPLDPDLIEAGYLICGNNPVAIDAVATKLMKFDYKKIPQISCAFNINKYKLIDGEYEMINCIINSNSYSISQLPVREIGWKPALGWIGHIEE